MEFSVDRENGVIRGAKVLGAISKNRRRYTASARKDVVRLAEGKPVRMKHGNDNYADTVGWVSNLREEEDTVYGDVHLKPHHPLREQLLWDAEQRPGEYGLSIDAEGKVTREDVSGWRDVTRVEKLGYVALVTDPATVHSIRESLEVTKMDLQTLKSDHPELLAQLREEILAEKSADEEVKQERARLIRERDEAQAKLQESQKQLEKYQEVERRTARKVEIEQEAVDLKAGSISTELMEAYLDMKPETVTVLLRESAKRPLPSGSEPQGQTPTSSDGLGGSQTAAPVRWWSKK